MKRIENYAYDEILYPEIESVPKKFAITYRNKWMVDNADLLIAYVRYDWGGAYKTLQYAYHKGINVINLADNANCIKENT